MPPERFSGARTEVKMRQLWRDLSVLTLVGALLLGGCPVDSGAELVPGDDGSTGDGGSPASSSGSSSSTISDTAGSTSSFDNWLTAEFPDCAEPVNGDYWRDEILRLVNVERAQAGLPLLEHDQTLENQATQYACEMIHYDFFAHENPVSGTELADRAEEFGYAYVIIGENLAAGQSSPQQVMSDWMASDGHRANILSAEFTEFGVAVRTGGRFGTYWVQEFGRPLGP
jgi:uncharacterized protein YkwD